MDTLATVCMGCSTDLKMGSPHARKSRRMPNVPVKAIPMSLQEGGREGGTEGKQSERVRDDREGQEKETEGEGSGFMESQLYSYSHFRVFSPDCTLHTAITHVISVLERWRLTHDDAIGIHMRLHHSNTFIT